MRGAVNSSQKAAFTLAEMMVVLLILSITLAAMAPVMTTKAKHDRTQNSSPWRWVGNSHTHAYFGQNQTQMGMIGQKEPAPDDNARLIINNTNDNYTHMLFKNDVKTLARLGLTEDSISLGSGKVADDVKYNTSFGIGAMPSASQGDNTAIGYNALNSNGEGQFNTAVGSGALASNTSDKNTAIGYYALNKNDGGEANVAVGDSALKENTTGVSNIAIGSNALAANTKTGGIIAIGTNAMSAFNKYSVDYRAIAIGNNAMANVTGEGSYAANNSIAIGTNALNSSTVAHSNTVIGHNAMRYLNGNDNLVIGKQAMGIDATTSVSESIAIGNRALYSGGKTRNIAIGQEALLSSKGNHSIAIGHYALQHLSVGDNSGDVAVGNSALQYTTTGKENIAVGHGAANKNTTGLGNVAIGSSALYNNETGQHNVAIGRAAMHKSTGSSNVALGWQTLSEIKNSSTNIAIGWNALNRTTANRGDATVSGNIAIGSQAMTAHTGSGNIAIGNQAMYSSPEDKDPHSNIAIGNMSLNNVGGNQNTAIGRFACRYVLGSNKICIGYNSGPYYFPAGSAYNTELKTKWATDDVERIFIGGAPKFTANGANTGVAVLEVHNTSDTGTIFAGTSASDDNKYAVSGNLSTVVVNANLLVRGAIIAPSTGNSGWQTYGRVVSFAKNTDNVEKQDFYKAYLSDRRLKYVGAEFKSGLDKIRQLKVFNYTFKKDKEKTPHVGVIAQDLEKIFPNAVTKNKDGFLMIRMEDMFYALINAVKELDEKLTVILNELKDIKTKQIEILRSAQNDKSVILNEIKRLEKQNAELKARLDKLEKR